MGHKLGADYSVSQTAEWLAEFDADAEHLRSFLADAYGQDEADAMLSQARERFVALIPQLPYIGGDENHLTGELVRAARCLAVYQAMQAHGKTAAEAGKVLYDAAAAQAAQPSPTTQLWTGQELMRRRRERAGRSQRRQYPADWVYTFVPGDGEAFDYGYDFTECAARKLYRAHGADELLPYYCFLDFAVSKAAGLGLRRTMTLAEGHAKCDHRFKRGRPTGQDWPPPCLRQTQMNHLTLSVLPQTFAVCHLSPAEVAEAARVSSCSFWSVTRTQEELSVVVPEEAMPAAWQAERGWRCLKVQGPLDFSLTGILSSLSVPLAEVGISIFALSTYDTDYLLVRALDLDKAIRVLNACGHDCL
jgi:hypothetical protein